MLNSKWDVPNYLGEINEEIEWETLYKTICSWIEKLDVIWDGRASDVKFRWAGKIV